MSYDPNRLVAATFTAAVLIGAILLALPIAHAAAPVSFIDAMFMAVSAVCVTGLSVVDMSTAFTPFGQAVILLLIQIGGIGIITLSSALLLLFGESVSLSARDTVIVENTPGAERSVVGLLRRVIIWSLSIEAIGALALFAEECQRRPIGEAVWYAVFHSISAFCNAGFALYPDNLAAERYNPGVVIPISILIILGGMGFVVLTELAARLGAQQRAIAKPLSLHTKLALSMTAVLLVLGTVGYLVLEWNNALRGASWGDRLLTSFFASVTARTAGFNTVDYGTLTVASLYFTIGLMLIGGCPGSTAGGIKATTVGVLVAVARARFLGWPFVHIFNRGISAETVSKAVIITTTAFLVVLTATVALAAIEVGSQPQSGDVQWSLGLMFEVVSALSTVGLTTGITGDLYTEGKVLLMVLMFIGRLGPLTVAVALSRKQRRAAIQYAEERIVIG